MIQNHWKCHNEKNKTLSNRSLLLNNSFNLGKDINYLQNRMIIFGYSFENYRPEFTQEELASYYADIANGFWQEWFSCIHKGCDLDGSMKHKFMNAIKIQSMRGRLNPNSKQEANYDNGFFC